MELLSAEFSDQAFHLLEPHTDNRVDLDFARRAVPRGAIETEPAKHMRSQIDREHHSCAARRLACVWAQFDVPAPIGADTPAR